MMIGQFEHSIDLKGRLIIPSKYRDELGEKVVVTKGVDRCLIVYSTDEWSRFVEKINQLPTTEKGTLTFVRQFFSGASEGNFDRQGRVLIPNNLREYCGLEKEAVIIGLSNRLEIWDKQLWENYNNDESMNFDIVAQKMAELGI